MENKICKSKCKCKSFPQDEMMTSHDLVLIPYFQTVTIFDSQNI